MANPDELENEKEHWLSADTLDRERQGGVTLLGLWSMRCLEKVGGLVTAKIRGNGRADELHLQHVIGFWIDLFRVHHVRPTPTGA